MSHPADILERNAERFIAAQAANAALVTTSPMFAGPARTASLPESERQRADSLHRLCRTCRDAWTTVYDQCAACAHEDRQ